MVGELNPSLSSEGLSSEELRRAEMLVDQGVGSYYTTRDDFVLPRGGSKDSSQPNSPAKSKKSRPSTGPGPSRRGGRSYREPSDSDLDPSWTTKGPQEPLTEEQRAINMRGIAMVREALRASQSAKPGKLGDDAPVL